LKEYIPYLYNNLSPGQSFELNFEQDLFELFGSEDLSQKGLVGRWNSHIGDFESARWNWSSTGLKGFTGLLHLLRSLETKRTFDPEEFEFFYSTNIVHQQDIVKKLQEEELVPTPFRMIYAFRYRDYFFPALTLRIEKMEWNPEEHPRYPIYITFVPEGYFVVNGALWKDIDKTIRTKKYWENHLKEDYRIEINHEIQKMISSYVFSQNIYRTMPVSLFTEKFLPSIRKSKNEIFYLKHVEVTQPELALSDNQIFWGIFHQITRTKQILYSLEISVNNLPYTIQNIPINTLSHMTDVYRQEAGSANVICHVLFDIFGSSYLKSEFGLNNRIGSSQTNILRRAVRLEDVTKSPSKEFANTNYDYAVFLNQLGIDHKILISLTVGLWRKGRKTYSEYLSQEKEMIFKTPNTTENVTVIWFMAPDATEDKLFSDPTISDRSLRSMINHITTGLDSNNWLITNGNYSNLGEKRIIVLAEFRETPQSRNVRRELENLLKEPRQTKFYRIVKQVIQNVLEQNVVKAS
jgi:hypothetical protein